MNAMGLRDIVVTVWGNRRLYLLRDVVDAFGLDILDPRVERLCQNSQPMLRFGDSDEGIYVDHFLREPVVPLLAALSPRSKQFIAQELTVCLYGIAGCIAVEEDAVEDLGILKRKLPRSWPDCPRFKAKIAKEVTEAMDAWRRRKAATL